MNALVKRWLIPLAAVAALLLIIAWMAGSFHHKVAPGRSAPSQAAAPGPTHIVAPARVAVSEPVPATIGARQTTTISSRIIARITRIEVRAGDSVQAGQLLLRLESSELESRLSQAQQRVRSISARLTEARQALQRAEQLQQQGLVAVAVLDEARASHDALSADLASARRAAEEAEIAISYTEIRSPFDGRVVDRFAEPGDTASPGERLLTLYNPLSLRIEAPVRESLALPLRLDQALDVEVPVLGLTLPAHIEELVPAADPGSRSFLVKARIDYQEQLLPGMYARLLIPTGEQERLLIPAASIVTLGQLDAVWLWQDGQAERRFVRLGRDFGEQGREVLAGLEVGDTLLLSPPQGQ